jgi:2,3-bisphosphoglycerate-dependent phosphoglycerate mutase
LSDQGILEAKRAGQYLKSAGFEFDVVFASALKRAIKTAWTVLDELNSTWVPLLPHWRLNERHYGGLQGLNKAETAAQYGEEQVKIWRRAFDALPPDLNQEAIAAYLQDRRYKNRLDDFAGLKGESLSTTIERVIPVWDESIAPAIRANRRVLIAAHGNSLRALLKHLANLSNEAVLELNIPTAQPLVLTLDADLNVTEQRYLASEDEINAAQLAVAVQAKAAEQ